MIDLGDGRVLPVIQVRTNSYEPVLSVLSALDRVVPVGLLRRVEESIVEIVRSNDPAKKILVTALNEIVNLRDGDLVLGVGLLEEGSKGYQTYGRSDLIRDVLTESGHFDAREIVRTTLPAILRSGQPWLPVYSYLVKAGLTEGDSVPDSVRRAMTRELKGYGPVPNEVRGRPLNDAVEEFGLAKSLNFFVALGPDEIDAEELHTILLKYLDDFEKNSEQGLSTAFGRATALYDRAKYAPIFRVKNPSTSGVSSGEIREWATMNNVPVKSRGRIPQAVIDRYEQAHA